MSQLLQVLQFTNDVFEAALAEPRQLQPHSDAPMSGSWSRELPGVKRFVPALRQFAQDQCHVVLRYGEIHEFQFGLAMPPIAGPHSIAAVLEARLFGETVRKTFAASYPTPAMGQLCLGQWATFGVGQVKLAPGTLLPGITPHGPDGVEIAWSAPPEMRLQVWKQAGPIRRFLGRQIRSITRTGLERIVVTPDLIDIQTTNWTDSLIPKLVLV